MAQSSISVDQDQFICPVCLHLLIDPVTVPCGHSYCMECINSCWDLDDRKGLYSCPQCRETFTPRPVLRRNNMLTEVVEKLQKTDLRDDSPAPCYAGAGDVECDFCTEKKLKASKSCLVCVASLCETHLKTHLEIPALMKHKLVDASARMQEKICSQHDKVIEIYCRTDQSCICYLCAMHEHKGHDTVAAAEERAKKLNQLKEVQRRSQQRLQEKEKQLLELKQSLDTLKRSAQAAVEDSENIFTELIRSIEKKRSEVTELIRAQETAQLSHTGRRLKQLEQEITDLRRRHTELEQLSHTDDHIHFIQSFRTLRTSSGCEDSPGISVRQHPSFDGVRKALSDLKERLEEELSKIPPLGKEVLSAGKQEAGDYYNINAAAVLSVLSSKPKTILSPKPKILSPKPKIREDFLHCMAAAVQKVSPYEPKTREDFLHYFCRLTLDPNTLNHDLSLSEENRVVTYRGGGRRYSDHPERFDYWNQVLCKESVCGRCYWEVERSRGEWVGISVTYKEISRKGRGDDCVLGLNSRSWSLCCSSTLAFWHNDIKTELPGPFSSRIGVYVDHGAGTLSFYSVSDTMTLLHAVHTTFTQPLYAGFRVGGTVTLSDPKP